MDGPKTRGLLKWILVHLFVIATLIAYAIVRTREQSDFEHDQKVIDKLFLDPNAPAISDEDRKRVKAILEGE